MIRDRMKPLAALSLFVALLSGCTPARTGLPVYAPADANEAMRIIHTRDAAITRVQARAAVRLTDAAGKSVELDGALVLSRPGNLRLRTWKMGQAVLDLTVIDGEAFAFIARDEAADARQLTQSMLADWTQILLDAANPQFVMQAQADASAVQARVQRGESTFWCTWVKPTLVLQRVDIPDLENPKSTILLADHRIVAEHVWPMRVSVRSEQGRIDIYFKDVELNTELSPYVFKPPARAEKLK